MPLEEEARAAFQASCARFHAAEPGMRFLVAANSAKVMAGRIWGWWGGLGGGFGAEGDGFEVVAD